MLEQANHFKEESAALAEILAPLGEQDFRRKTLFKEWTINDVLRHLHVFNYAADLTLESTEKFKAFYKTFEAAQKAGKGMREFQSDYLEGMSGRRLFDTWRDYYVKTAEHYLQSDPKTRVAWAGPEMSARSSITARQMETWAHGQAIFDLLGIVRQDTDRIQNIAYLGVNTFGWTFVNRGLEVPTPAPYVRLTAPSGAIWEWNEPSTADAVEGSATEFSQVVAQVRNIADTHLRVTGDSATRWMAIAQCFAGPPETPPAPGTRYTRRGAA